jgi:hypothetical protein
VEGTSSADPCGRVHVSLDSLGILGRNRPTLEQVRPCWQVVWCLCLHRHPGWWTGGRHRQLPLHLCPPRTDLRPSWVQNHLFSTIQPDRDPWWYVHVSSTSSYSEPNLVSWNPFSPFSSQALRGVRERLQARMAPANLLRSNWKSHLSKVRASGRSSPSTTLSPSKFSAPPLSRRHPRTFIWLGGRRRVSVMCKSSCVCSSRLENNINVKRTTRRVKQCTHAYTITDR